LLEAASAVESPLASAGAAAGKSRLLDGAEAVDMEEMVAMAMTRLRRDLGPERIASPHGAGMGPSKFSNS
jgi:hypothetical protein